MSNLFPQEFTAASAKAEATTEAGFYATTADMTVYVATTGSDTTGDGTVGNPYATVERAYSDIPRVIRHKCKVLIEAGNYAGGWPKAIAPIFEDNASLSFIGVGAPTVVSGPWTITGVAALGTAGDLVTVGAGGLGAVDSLVGQMVLNTTAGARLNVGYMIAANTDTTITLVKHLTLPPVNGDTFNLVVPSVNIKTDLIRIDVPLAPRTMREVTWAAWETAVSPFNLHNIAFDFTDVPNWFERELVLIRGGTGCDRAGYIADVMMPFVTFKFLDGALGWVDGPVFSIANTSLSSGLPPKEIINDGATGIEQADAVGFCIYGIADADIRLMGIVGDCEIGYSVVHGSIFSSGQANGSNFKTTLSSIGQMCMFIAQSGSFYYTLFTGKAGSACLKGEPINAYLQDVHFCKGTNAIFAEHMGSRIFLRRVTCDSAGITAAPVLVGPLTTIHQREALANFVSAGAPAGERAYKFTADVAVKSDTWLAASGNSVTDAKGAFITRLD